MAHLGENAVDCIVSDYEIPGTNGLEFLATVRDVYPDLPFILFTGNGSETVANDAISMGVTDYLQKGTSTEQYELLCNRIQNAVEKHHAECELEQTANSLQIVLDNVPSAVFLIDRAAGTRALSEFGKELLGIQGGSVEGRDPEQLVETSQLPPETAEEIVGMHQQTLSTEDELTAELTIPTSNGTREVHARTVPWYTDSEEPAGVCGVGMDITEQKRRERQLQHERDRLDEFASVVSHDLRSPLQVATGQVELLREECDSERLDDLAQAHDRMDTLIDDLLTLAREGEHVDELEAVDLETLTRRCWQNVATAEATVVTTTDQTIRANRRRLQQLVENLVRNTVEHGSEAVTVTVTVGDLDDGFYVADDGPGIPADERGEVFDAGYSTSVDGTGFGLSIVRQVAKAHGWEITVTDSETGGARFEITGVDVETED